MAWHCGECGWEWPMRYPPFEDSECDNCGAPGYDFEEDPFYDDLDDEED